MGSSSRPIFFKIILVHTLEEKKLNLPPRFLSEYGDLFPTTVLLKLPNGRKWKVGLVRKNGRACLQNGWQEFAEYCSLDVGHLLVFMFDGDSSFNVFNSDRSAFEIDYPCKSETEILSEFENNNSAAILHNNIKKTSNTSSTQRIDDDLSRTRVSFKDDKDKFHAEKISCSKGRKPICRSKKFEALQKCSFKSTNSFFKMLIQPSYMKYGMCIPADFARRYFCNKYGDCSFSIGNGRTWLVSYQQQGLRSRVKILSGFAKFLRDNNLKVGDVCVFELKKVEELSFKVSIFPAKKDQYRLISQGKKRKMEASSASATARNEEKDRPLFHSPKERDLNPTCWNPYFRIIIYPSHVNHMCLMSIPSSFVETYFKDFVIKRNQEAILQASDGKKKWVARLFPRSENDRLQIRFSCNTFVADNDLKADDVCVFESIKDVKVLKFNVFIFRSSESKNSRHRKELDLFWPKQDPVMCSSSRASSRLQIAEKL